MRVYYSPRDIQHTEHEETYLSKDMQEIQRKINYRLRAVQEVSDGDFSMN